MQRNAWLIAGAFALNFGLHTTAMAQTGTVTTVVTTPGTSQTKVIHVTVNDQPVTFSGAGPMMVGGGSVMVPLRGVFEQMGGQVQWEPATQVITGARPGHQFRIRVGSSQALVDGTQKSLTTPPQLEGGTTYVPLRFASEALGAQVSWVPDTNTVVITAIAPKPTVVKKTTTTTTTTTTMPTNP